MKRTYQIVKVTAASGKTSIVEQLRQDYGRCTGFFVVPKDESTNLKRITVSLKIANNEVLPTDTDLMLFAFNEKKSVAETMYDFTRESIASRSAEAEIVFNNPTETAQSFNVYFQLEN